MVNAENEMVATYRGIEVYIESDKKCEKIILPQSLFNYIIKLEKNKREYQRMQLEDIFHG